MKYQYIDIHTHNNKSSENLTIINVFPEDIDTIKTDKFYSLGLHPWEISNVNSDEQIKIIKKNAGRINVLAIGEIGLDKFKPGFEKQTDVFIKQIKIAADLNKPIIIHCVKAYSELLEILKKERLKIPVIIHRYSGNKTIADQLLTYNCYLSFGHELFNTKSKSASVFKNIPDTNIFLETDDSDLSVFDIYLKAAEIKITNIEDLKVLINRNFTKCFGNLFT